MPDASLRVVANATLEVCAPPAASGVLVIDTRCAVLSCNAAGQRLFGYSAGEILGRNIRTLIAPDVCGNDLEFYLRTGCGNRRDLIGLRQDGGAFPMEMSIGATREDGETSLVVIVDDMTERNHAVAERERLIQQLIASNEGLRDFARTAAHHLEAPSRVVSAFCSLLLERHGESLDAQGRNYLQLAERASARMLELVDDLIRVGRRHAAANNCAERAAQRST